MASPIIARPIRGRLYFQIGNVFYLFFTLSEAMAALSAANRHRLDLTNGGAP